MPTPNAPALEFLKTRRSRPAKILQLPVPDDKQLTELLTIAARTPDHGKLEPWRFIVIDKAAMSKLSGAVKNRAKELGLDQEKADKGCAQYDQGHLAVAVIEVQKASEKIPPIEQSYSAGAVCLALVNAALASGWGANWLSGWPSHDRGFMHDALALEDNERIAGIIHIGTAAKTPPERPRPDIESITTWI